jgi:hypothetical protein
MKTMMGCGCNERRTAIATAAVAVARGDVKIAADQARFVIKSAAQDAAALLRLRASAARMRLTRR